jgi:hypothetical protein
MLGRAALMRRRAIGALLLCGLAAAGLAACGQAPVEATPAAAPKLQAIQVPPAPKGLRVTSLVADGPGTAWLLDATTDQEARPLSGSSALFRFDHGWSAVPIPGQATALVSLASGGTGSVWALGYGAGYSGCAPGAEPGRAVTCPSVPNLLLHWNGESWRQVNLPARVALPDRLGPGVSITDASASRAWLQYSMRFPNPADDTITLLYYSGSEWQTRRVSSSELRSGVPVATLAPDASAPWITVPGNYELPQLIGRQLPYGTGPVSGLPYSTWQINAFAYGPGGQVWVYANGGGTATSFPGPVLLQLRGDRLVPVSEVPAAAGADNNPGAGLAFTISPAGDPVMVTAPGLANQLVYATYQANQPYPAWQIQEGPAHAGETSASVGAATAFPGSDAFLAVGDIADAVRLPAARPAPALAEPSILLPTWLGPGWEPVALPSSALPGVALASVSAAGPDDVLAGGAEDVNYGRSDAISLPTFQIGGGDIAAVPLILRWDGKDLVKQQVNVGYQGEVIGLAAGASGGGWAIVEDAAAQYHLLYSSGGAWRETPFPGQGTKRLILTSITAAPGGAAWGTGDILPTATISPPRKPLILRWVGGAWHQVPPPPYPAYTVQIAADSTGIWLAGDASPQGTETAELAHYTGEGWQVEPALTMTGAVPQNIVAVGLAAVGSSTWVATYEDPTYNSISRSTSYHLPVLWAVSPAGWRAVTRTVPFADMLPGATGPILIASGGIAADDGAFRFVHLPVPGQLSASELDGIMNLAFGAQESWIAAVPGTGRLWAVGAGWIATYR